MFSVDSFQFWAEKFFQFWATYFHSKVTTTEASIVREANAELISIDENLKRRNLTAPEKTKAIARRKVIWKERRAENSGAENTTIRGTGMPTGFASETAQMTGDEKSVIGRYLARADKLAPGQCQTKSA